MRVLLLSHSGGTGGATRSLQAMASDLRTAGCDVSIVAPVGNMKPEWEAAGHEVSHWKPPYCPWMLGPVYASGLVKFHPILVALLGILPLRLIGSFKTLRTIFQNREYDVVHINSLTLFPLAWILTRLLGFQKKRPKVIWHLREWLNPSLVPPIRRMIVDMICKQADHIIAITENEATEFINKGKVTVINNTIPATWDEEDEVVLADKANVVMAAALSPAKGLQQYLEMAERLGPKHSGVRFDLFTPTNPHPFRFQFDGASEMEGYMNESLKKTRMIQLDENRFWKLGHAITPQLYRDYGIYVRPDLAACPWGRDIIEAMWMGMVVVATGTFQGFVVDGRTGFLVPPGDVDALADRVGELLSNVELRKKMQSASRKRGVELFAPSIHAHSICEVFGVVDSNPEAFNRMH